LPLRATDVKLQPEIPGLSLPAASLHYQSTAMGYASRVLLRWSELGNGLWGPVSGRHADLF